MNKRTAEISTSGIAIVSMLHGSSRQCSTIGYLSNSWDFSSFFKCGVIITRDLVDF